MIRKSLKAISLIEVLIAIYIFGIGILVILRMLISNISWLYDLRAKDTAVSLAKEGMDIMYHLRDSNIEKGMLRDCLGITGSVDLGWSCEGTFLPTLGINRYIIDWRADGLYRLLPIVSTGDAILWYHTGDILNIPGITYTGFRYNHDTTQGISSAYKRWMEIYPQTNYPTATGRVMGVRSIVEYTRGNRNQRVVLESVIGDIR